MTVDPKYLAELLHEHHRKKFRMEWEGNKIPTGATINGVEIAWTQHGIVRAANGDELGYYDREMEFGGTSGNRQVIVISTDHSEVTPPPGGKVEVVERARGAVR